MPSYVLRGARVVDGTGADGRSADVVVTNGVIDAVTERADVGADSTVVDLDGLVLAPGFIDPHTHYDAQLCGTRTPPPRRGTGSPPWSPATAASASPPPTPRTGAR